jgi:carbon storage regulator
MLVLSRKTNQKIIIGEGIEITIVAVTGDTVRIGIEAPKHIKILRMEVYEEIQKQNSAAVISSTITENLKNLLGSAIKD